MQTNTTPFVSPSSSSKHNDNVAKKYYIVQNILGYLNVKTICKLRRVCSQWQTWCFRTIQAVDVHAEGILAREKTLQVCFENCTNLKHLCLAWCSDTNDATVEKIATHLTKLETLDLSFCEKVTNAALAFVAQMKKLRHVILAGCARIGGTQDGMKHLRHLMANKQLKKISFSRCKLITDASLAVLFTAGPEEPQLESGKKQEEDDEDAMFRDDKFLHLDLSYCENITDHALEQHVSTLHDLEFLSLRECKLITLEGLGHVATNLKKLKHLNVGRTSVCASMEQRDAILDMFPHVKVQWNKKHYFNNTNCVGIVLGLKLDNTRKDDDCHTSNNGHYAPVSKTYQNVQIMSMVIIKIHLPLF